jgi:hypothetical protein
VNVERQAISLEGFRRLNTFKAHSDKRQLEALLNRNGFSGLSELEEASTPSPAHPWGGGGEFLPERRLRTNMRGHPETCRGFESGERVGQDSRQFFPGIIELGSWRQSLVDAIAASNVD